MRIYSLLFIAAVIFSAGCATPKYKGAGRDKVPVGGGVDKTDSDSVVAEILKNAEKLASAGKPERAVMELENAARISPKRAYIYLRLGEIRYEQRLCHQATGMARKARQLGLKTTTHLSRAKQIITRCKAVWRK